MHGMAGQTQKGFVLHKHFVSHGSVRVMADFAVLIDRIMLENKGSLKRGVAGETEFAAIASESVFNFPGVR